MEFLSSTSIAETTEAASLMLWYVGAGAKRLGSLAAGDVARVCRRVERRGAGEGEKVAMFRDLA